MPAACLAILLPACLSAQHSAASSLQLLYFSPCPPILTPNLHLRTNRPSCFMICLPPYRQHPPERPSPRATGAGGSIRTRASGAGHTACSSRSPR
eukprot:5692549-Pleurochrysis_carterae.AAC.1